MNKLVAVSLAGLAGGVIGGAVVWSITKTVPPAVIVVERQLPGAENSIERAAAPHSASAAREDAGTAPVRSEIIPPALNASPPAPERGHSRAEDALELAQQPTAPAASSATQIVSVNQAAIAVLPSSVAAPGKAELTVKVDDALSFALEAAEPYVKEGFTVREDYWSGQLFPKQQRAIVQQLFKGNEYCFWMGTDAENAKISVHIYDSDGNLAEVKQWQKPHMAGALVIPKNTGSYYLVVEVEKSPQQYAAARWALTYGYR